MFLDVIKSYKLILASASPRRRELLASLGLDFELQAAYEVDESYPEEMDGKRIPTFLAEKKSEYYPHQLQAKEILITADTIVFQNRQVLTKPVNREDAFSILKLISGSSHYVYSGVCLRSERKQTSFVAETKVHFSELSDAEIYYYIDKYKPFDKAGAYGIQEWIGYVGVEYIEGSYFNVMGLPVHQLYEELKKFITN